MGLRCHSDSNDKEEEVDGYDDVHGEQLEEGADRGGHTKDKRAAVSSSFNQGIGVMIVRKEDSLKEGIVSRAVSMRVYR